MHLRRLALLGSLLAAPGTALAAPIYTTADLGTLGVGSSPDPDINAAGHVSEYSSRGHDHASLWDGTSTWDLHTLGGRSNSGQGISAAGRVIGHNHASGNAGAHAFPWDGTSALDLDDLIARTSGSILLDVFCINDPGQIAGCGFTNGHRHGHTCPLTPTDPAPVPEPGTLALLGTGLLGLLAVQRRRRKADMPA